MRLQTGTEGREAKKRSSAQQTFLNGKGLGSLAVPITWKKNPEKQSWKSFADYSLAQ
jgi:hypothetical protein